MNYYTKERRKERQIIHQIHGQPANPLAPPIFNHKIMNREAKGISVAFGPRSGYLVIDGGTRRLALAVNYLVRKEKNKLQIIETARLYDLASLGGGGRLVYGLGLASALWSVFLLAF